MWVGFTMVVLYFHTGLINLEKHNMPFLGKEFCVVVVVCTGTLP
jgi:hypothetical protein